MTPKCALLIYKNTVLYRFYIFRHHFILRQLRAKIYKLLKLDMISHLYSNPLIPQSQLLVILIYELPENGPLDRYML